MSNDNGKWYDTLDNDLNLPNSDILKYHEPAGIDTSEISNDITEWSKNFNSNLDLPNSDIIKYTQVDIANKYGLDTSTVDLVIYFFIFAAIISIIFLYFRANGYSLGNFLKGLHKHMYIVGKGPTKIRTTSVKKVIIPNE